MITSFHQGSTLSGHLMERHPNDSSVNEAVFHRRWFKGRVSPQCVKTPNLALAVNLFPHRLNIKFYYVLDYPLLYPFRPIFEANFPLSFFVNSFHTLGTKRPLLYKSILENMMRTKCNISQYFCLSHNQLFRRVW